MTRFLVRRAVPGDASALVDLARAVGSEAGGWLITDGDWRSPSEERRLEAIKLRAIDDAGLDRDIADDHP